MGDVRTSSLILAPSEGGLRLSAPESLVRLTANRWGSLQEQLLRGPITGHVGEVFAAVGPKVPPRACAP